jgi:hypothetical protein
MRRGLESIARATMIALRRLATPDRRLRAEFHINHTVLLLCGKYQ